MCAPNDVWSLGVILVNLTCGRNPWKQASFQDSTYRAFVRSPDFLKSILPVTDDLNHILGRIFNSSPEYRITLSELREMIKACPRLTTSSMATTVAPPSPPTTPDHISPYVAAAPEEAIIDDEDEEFDSPLSPGSTISDDGSLTSSVSTMSDMDDEFIREQQQLQQQEDVAVNCAPQAFEPEVPQDLPLFPGQEFIPQQYTGPVPVVAPVVAPAVTPQQQQCVPPPAQPPAAHVHSSCHPKPFPWWDVVRYVQQVPMRQSHIPFTQQVPVLPSFPGYF